MTTEAEWEKAWPAIATADVIVDALLGTGIRGGARDCWRRRLKM